MPPKRNHSASGSLRRSSRLSAFPAGPPPEDPQPKKKKAKTEANVPEKTGTKKVKTGANVPEKTGTKKAKTGANVPENTRTKRAKTASDKAANVPENSRTIIIERCTQCNSFKTRAIQVKEGLEEKLDGLNVVVNPEKPRRGCFEIREEDGEVFLSLLDLKRPFTKMKALNMEEEISKIVARIQGN